MKRIVVKIGTNVLEDNFGKLDYETMESLVDDISKIRKQGKDIILVTSGAIGAGMAELNMAKKPKIARVDNLPLTPLNELIKWCKKLKLEPILEQLSIIYNIPIKERYSGDSE